VNCLLLPIDNFVNADATSAQAYISDPKQIDHIHKVLGLQVGDSLKIGQLGGKLGSAIIDDMTPTAIQLREVQLTLTPPNKLDLTVVLALPRPKVLRRLIMDMTALGVAHIILINSYRSQKSYWQSPLVDNAHLHAAMLEGLEQCGDTQLPSIERATRFKPFVEDVLPALLQHRQGLLAHPYHSQGVPAASNQPRLLAIGPEGGFIPYEVEKLLAAGMQGFSLGPRILKVETAVPSIIGRLFL